MQLNGQQRQEIVSKIKSSNTFKNAPTSIALLQYLFDATTKGVPLKESVVDIEFFGNKNVSEKSNPRVRVNVYNLRKKIKTYYENEGLNDNWELIIDKGQYKVRFLKQEPDGILSKGIHWTRVIPYMGLGIAILIILYLKSPLKHPQIWQSLLTHKSPTHLFIGDHFGATGKTITNGMGWTRDFNINSINEFYDLLDKNPELKDIIKPAKYSYTTTMAALVTQQFQKLYQKHDRTFDIRFSTQTSISEIKEGNAIYAGPSKNKTHFIHFFNEANPYFKIKENTLIFSHHPNLPDESFNINNPNDNEEYAIVSKYPNTNNTEHLVFFSQHDIGVSATAEYFTNVDSISHFSQKYLKTHEHFTAVFKVKGQNRTNTSIELISAVAF
ncbi:hypothetical protein [Algibacter mikhailovii]|uniref:hypothetical protein n=1 Tax=Algibacter mikhailovii TaxID=425498 RepID=UPI0024954E77|nr:hypothetical protein [Algibacter mikhailovii]